MDKYYPLTRLLSESNRREQTYTFAEIEEKLGFHLPESAHKYVQWWANDEHHSHAKSWMEAGYQTKDCSSNIPNRKVRFVKI